MTTSETTCFTRLGLNEPRRQHSNCLCHRELFISFFLKKCCFLLFIELVLIFLVMGLAIVVIIFVMKPKTPIFSIQTVKIESYNLDFKSGRDLLFSSAISVTLDASNPNKIGISYGASRLYVFQEGLVVGIIRVARFNQPPGSKNVTIQAELVLESVNISKILSGKSLHNNESRNGIFQMRMLGDIRAQLQIFQVNLPKVKISMDCDINIDHKYLSFATQMNSVLTSENHMMSIPVNFNSISKRCSLAMYM